MHGFYRSSSYLEIEKKICKQNQESLNRRDLEWVNFLKEIGGIENILKIRCNHINHIIYKNNEPYEIL